jgi:hypothetical protein
VKNPFINIINDTLKIRLEDNSIRWSRTSLTMFSAWFTAIIMAVVDYCKHGIRYDVWLTLVAVALGSKISNSLSQKLNK